METLDHQHGRCPECGAAIQMEHPHPGLLLICGRCEEILVVKSPNPLLLDWAFEEPLEKEGSRPAKIEQ